MDYRLPDQTLYNTQIWKDDKLYMVSPRPVSEWPICDPLVSASKMSFDTYFTESVLPHKDLEDLSMLSLTLP